jgi:multicomponent Na+:H+ antiporter subunit D
MGDHLPILPVVVPLLGALLPILVALRSFRIAWLLAVATGLATTAVALAGLLAVAGGGTRRYAVGGWPPPWGIEVVLDPLSAFTATAIAAVGTVALVASSPDVGIRWGRGAPAFYSLALLTLAGLLGIVVSGDLFNVFVFLEVAAIAAYALVASGGGPALVAAFRYLVLGTVGASFYLLGVGLVYALTGTLNMADVTARLGALSSSPALAGGIVFIGVGLAIKMALFPLHGWLPDAYTHAPAPVVAFLAPVATKAAAYAMARILLSVLAPVDLPVTRVLGWAGAAAILVGGVLAWRQTDARRLLAYSSVSQMGYIALGLGAANTTALVGAYLHILNHAVMKAALFIAVGAVATAGRGIAVGALGRAMPLTAACAVVAALSMVGVPPAGGFFSKWYLLQGALEAGDPVLAAMVLIGSLLAAAYMYRLTEAVWVGSAPDAAAALHAVSPAPHAPAPAAVPSRPAAEAPAPVLVSLVVLAVATIAVGLGSSAIVSRVLVPAAAAGAR